MRPQTKQTYKGIPITLLSAVLSLFLMQCGDGDLETTVDPKNTDPSSTDTGTKQSTDTQHVPVDDGNPTGGKGTDSLGPSTAGTGDSDTNPPVEQGPVTIEIVNTTDQYRYIKGKPDGTQGPAPVRIGPVSGVGFSPYYVAEPWCMSSCEEAQEDICCWECDQINVAVTVIPPGETVSFQWDGIHRVEWADVCGQCSCYETEKPEPGPARIEVCSHSNIICNDNADCSGPLEKGWFAYADVTGDVTCRTVDFDFPYTQETLTFALKDEEPGQTSCDSIPPCQGDTPCSAGTQCTVLSTCGVEPKCISNVEACALECGNSNCTINQSYPLQIACSGGASNPSTDPDTDETDGTPSDPPMDAQCEGLTFCDPGDTEPYTCPPGMDGDGRECIILDNCAGWAACVTPEKACEVECGTPDCEMDNGYPQSPYCGEDTNAVEPSCEELTECYFSDTGAYDCPADLVVGRECFVLEGCGDKVLCATQEEACLKNCGKTLCDVDWGPLNETVCETDDRDTEPTCEDITRCIPSTDSDAMDPYTCPDGSKNVGCRRIEACGTDNVMCISEEDACDFACTGEDCISLDTDPPIIQCQ